MYDTHVMISLHIISCCCLWWCMLLLTQLQSQSSHLQSHTTAVQHVSDGNWTNRNKKYSQARLHQFTRRKSLESLPLRRNPLELAPSNRRWHPSQKSPRLALLSQHLPRRQRRLRRHHSGHGGEKSKLGQIRRQHE